MQYSRANASAVRTSLRTAPPAATADAPAYGSGRTREGVVGTSSTTPPPPPCNTNKSFCRQPPEAEAGTAAEAVALVAGAGAGGGTSLHNPSALTVLSQNAFMSCVIVIVYKKFFFWPLVAADVRLSCGIIKEEEEDAIQQRQGN
jgi:hypothetical protein